ncbi:hypothetical protein K488DRAFT_47289 [Vararia minispora EC-137]|uniref:Uncharacterized protein n=1 Tax=Vararia minispora EC-137 TaxID=1314806 RepID=A0ACB8QPN6_9AGAM|nr:hypothetical protein K488DRAFT_47289 [Vararia minispora EC-137]
MLAFPALAFPPDANFRQPLSRYGFEVIPFFTCLYVHALLVMLPHTRVIRVALLPITLWQAYYVITCLDYAQTAAPLFSIIGIPSERITYLNFTAANVFLLFSGRCIEWAFESQCHRRFFPLRPGSPPVCHPTTLNYLLVDAFELCCNHRGRRWSWSRNPFPPPAPSGQTIFFQLTTFVLDVVYVDALLYIAQLNHPAPNTVFGDSIFDPNFPPALCLIRACITAALTIYVLMFMLDLAYNFAAIVGRLFLGQTAWDWPPIFDEPWLSHSLAEFWGRRWHRVLRRMFIQLGSRPGRALGGRAGAVLGAFFVSTVLHVWSIWGMGGGFAFLPTAVFFMTLGLGTVLEEIFTAQTGWKVAGFSGWAWCHTVMVLSGLMMTDDWTRRGLLASDILPNHLRLGKLCVDVTLRVLMIRM